MQAVLLCVLVAAGKAGAALSTCHAIKSAYLNSSCCADTMHQTTDFAIESARGPHGVYEQYVPASLGGTNAATTPFFVQTGFSEFKAHLVLDDMTKTYNLTLSIGGGLQGVFPVCANCAYTWSNGRVQSTSVPTMSLLPFCAPYDGSNLMNAMSQAWDYDATTDSFIQPWPSVFYCQTSSGGDALTQFDPYGQEFDMLTGYGTSPYRFFKKPVPVAPTITAGDVISWVNNFWYLWEMNFETEFKALGTASTTWYFSNFEINLVGVDSIWANFRAPQAAGELPYQVIVQNHRVNLATRSCSYYFGLIMKQNFTLNGQFFKAGDIVNNAHGVLMFDSNWKWSAMWQEAHTDRPSGIFKNYPSASPPAVFPFTPSPALSMTPTTGDVISWVNNFWYVWENKLEAEFKTFGTPTTTFTFQNFNFALTGLDAIWADFRLPQGDYELPWQVLVMNHRVDLSNRLCAYNFQLIMKNDTLGFTAGQTVNNAHGITYFDANWKWSAVWQEAYTDRPSGITGFYPSTPPNLGVNMAILPASPTIGDVITWVNEFWFAWEFFRESEFKMFGTDSSSFAFKNFNIQMSGLDTIWQNFRIPQGIGELPWQIIVSEHRVNLAARTCEYKFKLIMKTDFGTWTAGEHVNNAHGMMTYDGNGKWVSIWQEAYTDQPSGIFGNFPSTFPAGTTSSYPALI